MRGRKQSDVEARLSLDIDREVHDDAEARLALIEQYIAHVFDGGDPTVLPDSALWSSSPVKEFASRIVNFYRESQGQVGNPFHPSSLAFKLFDLLYGEDWHERSEYDKIIRGQHVTTWIKEHKLQRSGYSLEKRSGSPVAYRIVSIG